MKPEREPTAADVTAAQTGDPAALDRITAAFLPLVYKVVGREMDGHDDVDDVVQETMVRVVTRLGTLREPRSFRSWLVAVAMNEVRRRWSSQQLALAPVEPGDQLPDPDAEFVDLTILRLGLLDARRELTEASRWLDEEDRRLLALWRQESRGELRRPELARLMRLPACHVGVRIQRLKTRLSASRAVVRALAASPGCEGLAATTAGWDGALTPLWRKRTTRHVRSCASCSGDPRDLLPVEVLTADLELPLSLTS
ncbi:sigma-70 family RNA polymerase sigma factor [Kitasatospora sp. NPDC094015]|uniref:sigma-70 family RNA polymerase sigma factor n=1 Tax=Kitasatospora sp. NPDC094015 TaxID=3155205 RepID=UPI003324CD0A